MSTWSTGFVEGLEHLGEAERETLLCGCAKHCAESAPVGWYRDIWKRAGNDIGRFFRLLGESESISTAELEPGAAYEVRYSACVCELYTRGYTKSPHICECTRQSLIHCMRAILPEAALRVETLETIRGGAKECRFCVSIAGAVVTV